MFFNSVLLLSQLCLTLVMGIYFLRAARGQKHAKSALERQGKCELAALEKLQKVRLSRPLSEQTRPQKLNEIIGQQKGVRALAAGLCGPNPQHILIYGPCGVGKTAAARLALGYAKKSEGTPFLPGAPFIECDATCLRYDERGIADPLLGSVHDPIYQGAGAYGQAGVPRPKAGAVTKAHGGVLFLDEIGEMAPVQMNKLLKVLEDGKVFFESAYYAADDAAIPAYIHKIFKEGMPADFRLIGATTRRPEEIPPALRSRCMEIYFDPLGDADIEKIAKNAMDKVGMGHEAGAARLVCQYAQNGRDAVNIVQTAASLASLEKRSTITTGDICWVADCGKYAKHVSRPREQTPQIGAVCGLAVDAGGAGRLMDIEAHCRPGTGRLLVTGIVEEEELENGHSRLRRKSTARSSAETALALLDHLGLADAKHYDFYVNFPGGVPVDGPSAGTAIFTALYSAATGCAVPGNLAMTGEITLSGRVLAVGGVGQKLAAAASCGVKTVFIPKDNDQADFHQMGMAVTAVTDAGEILEAVFGVRGAKTGGFAPGFGTPLPVTAAPGESFA